MKAPKQRAERNRTLSLTEEETRYYHMRLKLLGNHEIADTKEIENCTILGKLHDTIEKLPDAFADLIILDPPYNLAKDFNGLKFTPKTHEEYLDYLRSWFPSVCKKLKPNGSLYLCGDWKSTSALQTVMEENLRVINRITWQREKGRGAQSNWKNAMEDIWFGVKNPKNYYFDAESVKMKRKVIAPYKVNGEPKDWEATEDGNYRLTFPSNFWDDITIPYWSMPENTDHPTQKPEKLIARLILASCPSEGMVFDPFLGSGTTSVVAKKLGRKYCGIEQNAEYAAWAEKRLELADADKTIQGYSDGVFWERNTFGKQKSGRAKI
jgi:site-specific DNA-methyltransferase (adenine-specific)